MDLLDGRGDMSCLYCGEPIEVNLRPGALNWLEKHEACRAKAERAEYERTRHLLPCPFKRTGARGVKEE